ncbi:AAA family ATPase [Trueperella sp. LYQ143]|uniref:AAA family ATPase n=1 Tax=Trueperella sp. LYQ143 TaxID=3391059 RepID=UPI003983921D
MTSPDRQKAQTSAHTSSADEHAAQRALAEEQHFVDQAYRAFDRQYQYYLDRLSEVRAQTGHESPGARSERDSFATHYEDNLIRLRNLENRLVLGRLDMHEDTVFHIGRMALRDEEHNILLTDWRAPQSQPFYQATAAQPGQVRRRRHIQTRFRTVTAVEDELLENASADDDGLNLTGEGALMAAMNSARDGKMGDIVATIQGEQDRIIRAPAKGVLVVQGGPGTGKTAVALHRAAYLLYTHRDRLAHSGVLIIGPSTVFLRYIDQVLPSLGESDVVSTTLEQLVPNVEVTGTDDARVTEIKGRLIWSTIAKRTVRQILQKPLDSAVSMRINGINVMLTPDMVDEAQRKARRSHKPHNEARDIYATMLVQQLATQLADAHGRSVEENDWLSNDVAQSIDARREINLRWLPSSATTILARLYAKPHLLARVAPELSQAERDALYRPLDAPMTRADVAIIDEFEELLGPLLSNAQRQAHAREEAEDHALNEYVSQTMSAMNLGGGIVSAQQMAQRLHVNRSDSTLAERAASDRQWTYGHVVVDEAQELTPLQWRMIARRNPAISMTIVGDVDQRTVGAPEGGWQEALADIAPHCHIEPLTISYRTPARVLERAQQVMEHAGFPVRPIQPARDLPHSYRVHGGGVELLCDLVQNAVRDLDNEYGADRGSIGIIVPENRTDEVAHSLQSSAHLNNWTLNCGGTDLYARIHIVTPRMSKGLEYDIVILVEPAEILADGPGDLYVAMTRPTRRLDVISTGDLPAGFTP